MNRAAKISLSVVGVLALVLVGVAVYALTPSKAQPYEDPVPIEAREANTAAAVALTRFGVEDFTVDASDERMLIVYELPAFAHGDQTHEETFQRLVLAAGAAAAPGSERVIAAQTVNGTTTAVWGGMVADFEAFEAGTITAEELDARIERGEPAAS